MGLTVKRYSVYEKELTQSSQKRMIPMIETDSLTDAWECILQATAINAKEAKNYQLIEKEDSGVLFVRLDLWFDGRPFCKSAAEMGPDKFGYNE